MTTRAFVAVALVLSICPFVVSADEDSPGTNSELDIDDAPPWSVTVYGAMMTWDNAGRTFFPPTDLAPSYTLLAAGLGRRVATIFDRAQLELEGQLVQHLGQQKNTEINGLGVGRWVSFPWNRHVPTTIAIGIGMSYATSLPVFEIARHGKTANWLTYMMFEATLSPPRHPQWAFVYRIHHRSGALETFGDMRGASNALGFGVKYRW